MPAADAPAQSPWYATAFGRLWLHLHPHRDDAEAMGHAAFIVRVLGLKAGQRVLDVGCGGGRYARALAARGLKVTGVDLSAEMLEAARAASPNLPGSPIYLRADARALPFVAQFEGAVSLFTSLGYFDAREDDLNLLRGVARALVPGGAFLLDYLNPAHVRATLVADEEGMVDGYHVHVRRTCEEAAAGPVVVKRVTVRHAGARRVESEFFERVRLYEPAEIDALLADAGLVPEGERWGSLEGAPYEASSERQVRLARKPARR